MGNRIMRSYLLLLSFFLGVVSGCAVDEDRAHRILRQAGYTDVVLKGYAWFGCGKDDTWQTEFTATGPSGHPVKGEICCGTFLKDCTIRFD